MRGTKLRRLAVALVVTGGTAASAEAADAAVFTVTNTADSGAGSLRTAIESANALAGPDSVHFNVPGAGSHTIVVTSAQLPGVSDRLTIDGSTQPGFAGIPLIRIHDGLADPVNTGLLVFAGQSRVKALSITGFMHGIQLSTNGGDVITGNRIGVTPNGAAVGNSFGVTVLPNANTIGGPTPAERNLISGNDFGVAIYGTGNAVQGNFIGTNAAGTAAVPGSGTGVVIWAAARSNVVGGTASGAGNLISGNTNGVSILQANTMNNVVAGNRIGTNLAGSGPVPNGVAGVAISDRANGNTIGGTTAAARNIISGNTNAPGVSLNLVSGTVVAGNFIGTTSSGAAALPNARGVLLAGGASRNTVGGDRATSRNVISGNSGPGVELDDPTTDENVIAGNDIGPNLAASNVLPNAVGVLLSDGPRSNTIGGTSAARRNVISGNLTHGVDLRMPGTDGNVVPANYIGTKPSGLAPMPNGGHGIDVATGAGGNRVGGPTAGERNVISGNDGSGVHVESASSNRVVGNYIGLNAAGDSNPLRNADVGVRVSGSGATGNRIGGTAGRGAQRHLGQRARRRVHHRRRERHAGAGQLHRPAAAGVDPLPNGGDGVAIDGGADDNTVGGTAAGAKNAIAFNEGDGVSVDAFAAPTNGDAILGNAIFDNRLLGITLIAGGNDAQPRPRPSPACRPRPSTRRSPAR